MAETAQAWARPNTLGRVVEFVRPHRVIDSSSIAHAWLHGNLADLRQMPWLGRIEYSIRRALRLPAPKFYDICGIYGTREEARERCTSRDSYIVSVPYGQSLGLEVSEARTFCRPLHPDYEAQDERDSIIYLGNLSDSLCAETEARLRELNQRLDRLVPK